MALAQKSWLLLGALFAGRAYAAVTQSLSPTQLLPRNDALYDIDTAGDDDLEDWLAALERAPASTVCPLSCRELQAEGQGWAIYPDQASLAACNKTMMVDFVFKGNTAAQESNDLAVHACGADFTTQDVVFRAQDNIAARCTTPNHVMIDRSLTVSSNILASEPLLSFSTQHLLEAGRQVSHQLLSQLPSCEKNALSVAYFQSSVIGVFGGAEIHQHGLTSTVLDEFLKHAEKTSLSKTTILQLCDSDGRGADYAVGIIASSAHNLNIVQNAIRTWEDGRCVVDESDTSHHFMTVTIRVPKADPYMVNSTRIVSAQDDNTSPAHVFPRASLNYLDRRAVCKTTKVKSGDGCWAVADRCKISQEKLKQYNTRKNFCNTLVAGETVCCSSGTLPSTIPKGNADGTCKSRRAISGDTCTTLASKCGISGNDFMKVNKKTNLCSTLVEGQKVCCSSGTMPSKPPKKKSNGYCADYTVQKGDGCAKIAIMNDITVNQLKSYNKQTWGWIGCDPLYTGKICLSEGSPPMPASVANAVCGPTVVGTNQPASGKNISSLNPCPLNACCNNWGNCGLTEDFCKINKAKSGNPGTAPAGESGCIYNCGMDIVKGSAPSKKYNVAYFEGWNRNRKCLHMDVDMVDTSRYNTIHFAFIDITQDFKMDLSEVKDQFSRFKAMSGVHKVASFGGWDFSNSPSTFRILREATKSQNRATFVSNLVKFVKDHSLDGIDVDWEYPGAPDIPDIPPGDAQEGDDYYQTLLSLKKELGTGKTVSFAAPASFHYLKSFPIKKMGAALDYVIFMTYDLHGQWDYGNQWTTPGCAKGNCLRSHVNETETKDALAMITKAGVPSGKVVVGVSSYGRSFKMAKAGCDGVNCLFTGTSRQSQAKKGRCTSTAGYVSNAEINEILSSDRVTRKWKAAGSNILVYDQTEWVGYMDEATKKTRESFYNSYNFAGTTDWAVDLQEFYDDSVVGGNRTIDDNPTVRNLFPKCKAGCRTLDGLKKAVNDLPDHCVDPCIYSALIYTMEEALKKYSALLEDGYDKKFESYAGHVRGQVPVQINRFLEESGDDYFQCKEFAKQTCCSDCTFATCWEKCVRGDSCKSGLGFRDVKCPSDLYYLEDPSLGKQLPNTTWALKNEDGFFKALNKKYGIEKSWVKFGTRKVGTASCYGAGKEMPDCIREKTPQFYDYPIPDKVDVFNPKTIIGKSHPESKDLLRRLKIQQTNAEYDSELTARDLVDAASIPAFAMEEAVKNMGKIVETADKLKDAAKKESILNFVTGILFFIPFIGSAAGSVGMVSLRSMLTLIGAAGEAGLLVYGIVEDPTSAVMAVFGLLASGGLSRSSFRGAASARRGISSKELAALGPIKDKLDMVRSLQAGKCSI